MTPSNIIISNEKETRVIDALTIYYIHTSDYLSSFHLHNNDQFICAKSLVKIEKILPSFFFRINRSTLVNLYEIKSIKNKQKIIVIKNGTELIVSERRVSELKRALVSKNTTFTK